MNKDEIFDKINKMIDARALVSKILGAPAKQSGDNWYWNSPFVPNGDTTPSFTATESQISDFSSNSNFGNGNDVCDFIVKYNNYTHQFSSKDLNNYEAAQILNEMFGLNLNIEMQIVNNAPVKADIPMITVPIVETKEVEYYTLENSSNKPDFVNVMFDTQAYNEKPQNAGSIKNNISNLKMQDYTLLEFKQLITTGHTCIPAGIKSSNEWIDNTSQIQVFMIDIDNTAMVNGEKKSYTINDPEHISIEKMIQYCTSINLEPTFIYTSFSNTEMQHRFRLVYILDKPLKQKAAVEGIYSFLTKKFEGFNIDTAPTNISSLFFGGKNIVYTSNKYYSCKHSTEVITTTNSEVDVLSKALKHTKFFIYNGYLCEKLKDDNYNQISNFIPYITDKITYLDGTNTNVYYKINCLLLDRKDEISPKIINEEKYKRFDFIKGFDVKAIVVSKNGNADKVREVCQRISIETMKENTMYSHTGMIKKGGKICYLYDGGTIGGDDSIDVDLKLSELKRVNFNNVKIDQNKFSDEESFKCSLNMLNIAEHSITIPLMALIFLAPIYSLLVEEGIYIDFILYVQGKSGSRKSSIVAAFASHFGNFDRDHFTSNFRDSVSTLEKKASVLKDILNVIDDYNPEKNVNEMLYKIEKIIAMYGDRIGRGRMMQDGETLKEAYVAKGVCISTGELIPATQQSRLARMIQLNIKNDSVNDNELLKVQTKDGKQKISYCMMQYIKNTIENVDSIKDLAQTIFKENRNNQDKNYHGRTNENIIALKIGYYLFLNFMKIKNIITETQLVEMNKEADLVFHNLLVENSKEIQTKKPTEMFFAAVKELLATNQIYVKAYCQSSNNTNNWLYEGTFVGFYDAMKQQYYFFKDTLYNKVVDFYKKSNIQFPVNANTLWRYMKEEGSLHPSTDRITVKRDGNTVIAITASVIDDL